jgi:3-oxoacyl-[acyl-carrier-protein] synthase-3
MEALNKAGKKPEDLDMFIPHQANLRISQFVQQKMGLPDEKVFNNIQKYGNTTAASIPIALCEALDEGKVKKETWFVLLLLEVVSLGEVYFLGINIG